MGERGKLISRIRLEKGWSQEGLCSGICSVSYLSKIESGRAEASEEVLSLLFSRLGVDWKAETETEAAMICEKAREALFSHCFDELWELLGDGYDPTFAYSSHGGELELLYRMASGRREALDEALEKSMDSLTLGLQRLMQGRAEEGAKLLRNAYGYYNAGAQAYSRGDYVKAMEFLNRGYVAAAEDGSVNLMLLCKLFLGACCANLRDMEGMERHYTPARRMAKALGDTEALAQMDYNRAATQIECGKYEGAYAYFSSLDEPDMMSLHKLAICCEKTGRREEALAVLDKAEGMESEYPPTETAKALCDVVRYRLEHGDYLQNPRYGEALISAFDRCRRELSAGYAYFHLPWVLEWYKANRQYKKAMELLEDFPEKVN